MSKELTLTPLSSQNLKQVQQQFEQWRKTRKGRQPIPEHLWQAAAGLVKHHSINYVARLLRLNHTALKDKVEISKQESSAFVEIPLPDKVSPFHWTVEMEKTSGAKLTMSCQGQGAFEALVEMGKTFWGGD